MGQCTVGRQRSSSSTRPTCPVAISPLHHAGRDSRCRECAGGECLAHPDVAREGGDTLNPFALGAPGHRAQSTAWQRAHVHTLHGSTHDFFNNADDCFFSYSSIRPFISLYNGPQRQRTLPPRGQNPSFPSIPEPVASLAACAGFVDVGGWRTTAAPTVSE